MVSKLGLWPLVSTTKRIQEPIVAQSPAPNNYKLKDNFQTNEENLYPFNSTTAREDLFPQTDMPGLV